MIDWKRVLRTAIQSAAGAGIAFFTALATNFTKEAIISAVITFGCTVVVAVLMNIKTQTEEPEDEEAPRMEKDGEE